MASMAKYIFQLVLFTLLYWGFSQHYPRFGIILFIVIYVIQIFHLFKISKYNSQPEFFSFNYLFFIMLTLITYLIPIFHLLGLDDFVMYISPVSYEIQYIPKSLYLTSVAVSSFTFGFAKKYRQTNISPDYSLLANISHHLSVAKITALLAFILFLYPFYMSYQTGMMDVEGIVVTLVSVALIFSISIAGYSNLLYKHDLISFILHNKLILGIAGLIIFAMLFIGDRFFPLLILCSTAFIINHFVYKISLKEYFLLMFLGVIFMFYISFTRFSDDKSLGSAISQYQMVTNTAVVFQDIVPINLDFYLGLHYVDHKGFFLPERILVFLLKPIPFIPGYLTELFFGGNITTGDLLTPYNQTLVNVGSLQQGIGTHCIVDIYMSWGILGVIALFILFGCIVGMCYARLNNIYVLVAYVALVAGAIYIPRESLFSTFRIAIWVVILAAFLLRKSNICK